MPRMCMPRMSMQRMSVQRMSMPCVARACVPMPCMSTQLRIPRAAARESGIVSRGDRDWFGARLRAELPVCRLRDGCRDRSECTYQ